MARLGRPSSGQHTNSFLIKLTDPDNNLLIEMSKKTEKSKSDIIRQALRAYAETILKD